MFDEKAKTVMLPDKRFIFLNQEISLGGIFHCSMYDTKEDSLVCCRKITDKKYIILSYIRSYNLPDIYKENNIYKLKCSETYSAYDDYQIFNYKLKTLDISYTIEVKNNIRYITIPNDIHQAMFEFYFGQSIKTDFGDNNDINI
jgi:hypothetical protein